MAAGGKGEQNTQALSFQGSCSDVLVCQSMQVTAGPPQLLGSRIWGEQLSPSEICMFEPKLSPGAVMLRIIAMGEHHLALCLRFSTCALQLHPLIFAFLSAQMGFTLSRVLEHPPEPYRKGTNTVSFQVHLLKVHSGKPLNSFYTRSSYCFFFCLFFFPSSLDSRPQQQNCLHYWRRPFLSGAFLHGFVTLPMPFKPEVIFSFGFGLNK